MYNEHFGLDEDIFTLTPLVSSYCHLQRSDEALKILEHSIDNDDGMSMVIGDIGTGKTMVCKKLIDLYKARKDVRLAHITNPYMDKYQLVESIYKSLPTDTDSDVDTNYYQRFIDYVKQEGLAGNKILIIIDEAHLLSDESLEMVRLLSNSDLQDKKVVHLVFFAQPEMYEVINKPKFRHLMQRIAHTIHLKNFSLRECKYYFDKALKGARVFDDSSIKKIHKFTAGNPRAINLLAKRALLSAYSKGRRYVVKKDVNNALREMDNIVKAKRNRYISVPRFLMFASFALPVTLFVIWNYMLWAL